jgi:hypothetical protein
LHQLRKMSTFQFCSFIKRELLTNVLSKPSFSLGFLNAKRTGDK